GTPGLSAVSMGTWPGRSSNSPSSPGAVSPSVSTCATTPRGVITRTSSLVARAMATTSGLRQLGGVGADVVDRAGHREGLLREIVALALEDLLEAAHGVFLRAEDALLAGE